MREDNITLIEPTSRFQQEAIDRHAKQRQLPALSRRFFVAIFCGAANRLLATIASVDPAPS